MRIALAPCPRYRWIAALTLAVVVTLLWLPVARAASAFAYVTNAYGNDLSGFAVDAITGALTPIPGSPFSAGTTPISVAVDPTGKFAYVANFDSFDVWAYRISVTNGALTPIPGSPFPAGVTPSAIALTQLSFGIPFSRFGGGLLIDSDAGVFYLSGGFKLGSGGSINPVTEPVTFSVGSYSVTLPSGSFVKYKTGYVYQKTVNHIFLCVFIKFTSTPGQYQLLANRIGGALTSTPSPVPVTLAIGNDSGTAQMKAKFD